jgi:stage II sporulation protein E
MQRGVLMGTVSSNKIGWAIFKYVMFFALFYVLAGAGIKGLVFCFAFGALYGLVWCNQKVYILAPLYVLASLLQNFGLDTAITSCTTVLVLLVAYTIHLKLKKPIKPYLLLVYALVSQAAYVWLAVVSGVNIFAVIAHLVVGILFLFACMTFFTAMFVRGITSRLKLAEIISGCVFVMALSCGLSQIWLFDFEVVKFVGALTILLSAYCLDVKFSMVIAACFGVGTMLYDASAVYVAPFLVWALVVNSFKIKNRFVPVFALLAVEVVMGLLFQLYYTYTPMSFVSVALACLVFLVVSPKILLSVNATFLSASQNLAMRNIVNRNRDSLSRRFHNLSEVFCEMDKVFRSMIKGGLSIEEAKLMLKDEVKEKFVAYQTNGKNLRAFDKELDTVLLELISIALERNHVTLLDIPPFITSQYSNINALVSIINNTTDQYKQYASFMNNLDASKVLIAEQLTGVAKIMRSLSEEVGKNVIFDNAREEKIVNELTYNNIICSEAIIYEQSPSILNVSLVVKQEDSGKAKIAKIVSKILGHNMAVASVNPTSRGGWSIVELKNSPKFDIIFGTAGCPKHNNQTSGDTYSLIRIENDKFMMALCDGMGNGANAECSSALAVGLLENFYKAGFDNDIILNSVNNLLSLDTREDSFSSLDICVLDLKNGIADFVKLGATTGFVKHIDGVSKIECESLPIGIVRQIKPITQKNVLCSGDIVFLCTDGVVDSFENTMQMQDFIASITTVNPQVVAEELLQKALANNGGIAKDDMTILVARIYEK